MSPSTAVKPTSSVVFNFVPRLDSISPVSVTITEITVSIVCSSSKIILIAPLLAGII